MFTPLARRRALPAFPVLLVAVVCAVAPATATAGPGAQTPKGSNGAATVETHQPLGTGVGRKVG